MPGVSGDKKSEANQPKQPTNLQGLLKFALDATKQEDGTSETEFFPLDDERKKFLEDALKFMTINVVEVLLEQIKVLEKVETLKEGEDATDYLQALEIILGYIDNIDVSNDFHKIGGFVILKPCLNSTHPAVRAGGAALIAELCQNNPYCQTVVLDHEFVPILLHILNTDSEVQVGVKCLYALSAIVRENSEGFSQLVNYEGLNIFLKTLQKDDERFRIKTAFLLSTLCMSQADLKSRLIFLDILPVLISIISEERRPSHEYVLSLLVTLVEDSTTALNECKNPTHNLKEILQGYLSKVENKDEYLEEEQYCKTLLQLILN